MASASFERWWKQFVQTGDICPLKLGAERKEVEALFGPPDDFSTDAPDPATASIWKYDDLELRIEIFAAVAPIGVATDEDSGRSALGHLRWAVSEAQRIGYVPAGFEAQLMLGALQLQTGDTIHGRATLEGVRRDAEARGFRRVAMEAAEYLGGTRSAVPALRMGPVG